MSDNGGKRSGRLRGLVLALLAVLTIPVTAHAQFIIYGERYDPLGWRARHPPQYLYDLGRFSTPSAACAVYGGDWMSRNSIPPPYTSTIVYSTPGVHSCRVQYGVDHYYFIDADCGYNEYANPAVPPHGAPVNDSYISPPCACLSGRIDRSRYWCMAAPSCTWYPENKASGCGKTTEQLKNTMPTSPTVPTRNFHSTQTCIAERACNDRCQMENCNWMKAVIPDFVNPYLSKAGAWPGVEADCKARGTGWYADRECAREMAMYHIRVDLSAALAKSGCGSTSDWTKVFESVSSCTSASFGNGFERRIAVELVRFARQQARATCTAVRTAKGLDVAINNDLKGTTCTP